MRALLATAGLLVLAGAAGAATPQPHTLVRSTSGSIEAVTQDASDVAWVANGGSKCNTVHVLAPDGTEVIPQPTTASMTCHWDLTDGPMQLAYASGSSTALWTLHETGDSPVDYVMTAQTGGSEQRVDRLSHASDGTGLWLGGVVGAGTTLAYSFVDVEYVDKLGCLSGGSCKKQIAGGGINLVAQGKASPLAGSKPALGLAATNGLVAYIPATQVDPSGAPVSKANATIRIVDAASGATCGSVNAPGFPLAIALSPHVLAVLARSNGIERVSWYSLRPVTPVPDGDPACATTATQIGSAGVPRSTAPQLAASDRTIVYRAGSFLRGIAVSGGRVRTLARTALAPLGLSLQARQLTWAENSSTAGRIRALSVG